MQKRASKTNCQGPSCSRRSMGLSTSMKEAVRTVFDITVRQATCIAKNEASVCDQEHTSCHSVSRPASEMHTALDLGKLSTCLQQVESREQVAAGLTA